MEYIELKRKQEKEMNDFPMIWAFSNNQLEKELRKIGLTMSDTDKLYSFGGGGYYLKTNSKRLRDMADRHNLELKQAIENDKEGTGFIFEMFDYELSNHEYCITYDIEPTLEVFGLNYDDIEKSKNLKHGLKLAIKNQGNNF